MKAVFLTMKVSLVPGYGTVEDQEETIAQC